MLAGVREFPVRVKCASLAWHTLKAALDREARRCRRNEAAAPSASDRDPRLPRRTAARRHRNDHVADVVADPARTEALKPAIVEAISTVFDPEIPVNIWELGLIYDVVVDAAGVAGIR